jgi:oligopeptide/dipeptide ABC transporter ATP-binding protein
MSAAPLLAVTGLVKHYALPSWLGLGGRRVHAVDGVSFEIARGRTLALVGESGSGKTTVGRCLLRLVEPTAGAIVFEGRDLRAVPRRRFRPLRRHIQMVFQDFEAALNPRHSVHRTLREPLLRFGIAAGREADEAVRSLVREVELRHDHLDKYPHQLSGGQQQRVSIARALAPRPALVVLDEPLSSLDVSVRVQIADLFLALQDRHALSYLFISHDLAMVKYLAHDAAVMYLGQIVERAPVAALFQAPRHPYTQALIESVLPPDPDHVRPGPGLEGEIPSVTDPPVGCRFASRCPRVVAECRAAPVPLRERHPGHWVACIRA